MFCVIHENWAGRVKSIKELYMCKRCKKEGLREYYAMGIDRIIEREI